MRGSASTVNLISRSWSSLIIAAEAAPIAAWIGPVTERQPASEGEIALLVTRAGVAGVLRATDQVNIREHSARQRRLTRAVVGLNTLNALFRGQAERFAVYANAIAVAWLAAARVEIAALGRKTKIR